MKQHITIKQLRELDERGKKKLRKWFRPNPGQKFYDKNEKLVHYLDRSCISVGEEWDKDRLPLPSIGQMIEFLAKHEKGKKGITYYKELCNALWRTVREMIEITTKYIWAYEVSSEGVGKVFNPGPVTSVKEANEYVKLFGNCFRTRKEAVEALEKDGGKLEK